MTRRQSLEKLSLLAGSSVAALASSAAAKAESDGVTAFAAECKSLAAAALKEQKRVIEGAEKGWLFASQEVQHCGASSWWRQEAGEGVADMVIAWHEALKALGVDLVLLPVPSRCALVPHKLVSGAAPTDGPRPLPFYEKLQSAGLTVIDLVPTLRQSLANSLCLHDSHWSPGACALAAEAVWSAVKSRPWAESLSRTCPTGGKIERTLTITGDLAVAGDRSELTQQLNYNVPYEEPVQPSSASPILLLGDSHCVVFSEAAASVTHHTTGAGFRDHFQAACGVPLAVTINANSGSDGARALVARAAAGNPDYWKGKKALIWCFAEREFTQSRWRKIPPQP